MYRKLIKRLLAPVIREVLEEFSASEIQSSESLRDVVQSCLLKAVSRDNSILQ